jgi:hypothetical protein
LFGTTSDTSPPPLTFWQQIPQLAYNTTISAASPSTFFCFAQIDHGTRILLICLLEQHIILGSPVPGPIKSFVHTSIPS